MAQFANLAIFILGIVGQFSITQSAGLPSSSTMSPYNDMDLTSGLTSTSITTQKTIMLLHQILLQETSLRMDLEKTVRDLMKEFEQMKKNQAEVKNEQKILNHQLIDNITLLRTENQRLKDELRQMVNTSFSTSGMQTCKCDLTNITSDLHDFEREVRYNVSLSLLDFQEEMTRTKTSIVQSSDDKIGVVSRDISDIQSAFKNLSTFIDRDRHIQAFFNAGILVRQENISNTIKDNSKKVAFTATLATSHHSSNNELLIFPTIISNVGDGYNSQDGVFTAPTYGTYVFFCKITGSSNPSDLYFEFMLNESAKTRNLVYDEIDEEIMNLTTRFFSLETQMTMFDTSVRHLEQFLPKVRNFMNDTRDLHQILVRIQHEQVKISTDLLDLANNTVIYKKIAFSATFTQSFTSKNEQTLVFPHIFSNVGGGYNNQDGVFTAPLDGVYVFFCKITQASNSHDMYFEFILNGSAKTNNLVYGRSDDVYRTSSNLIVLELNRRDRVWIKIISGGLHYNYAAGGDQSFSGFML